MAVNQRWLWFTARWHYTEFSFLNWDALWPHEWNSTAGELYIQAALYPPLLQCIHLDRVVPAALEVQGAHQALFLLCVLGTKAKKFKSFSAVSKGERNKGLKKKNKGNDLDSAWVGRDSSECLSWLKSRTDNHTKSEGRLTVAKPTASLIREAFLFSFWQRDCAWRCQSLQHLPQLVWCQTWYPCLDYREWGNCPWLSMCPRLIQSFLDFFS